ncbi:MAG: hypothetical protein NZM40_00390 [Sphingomonadaceae bacterium]|uniref:flagellin N-terminal helical domain-containing protein n=1 Tax=Thermaurantiacus sp. TaxID=2820283 RepID=UPI00298F15EE|nr:hypothetical protein [Thermaurantiacus sp.]MCS6985900.1 hypothetical protein [Sphingomonadaceae bacterium]MDW8414884.1 hypothetical protein [Thermaurantiacus sp.]
MVTLTGTGNPTTVAADRMVALRQRIEELEGRIARGERFSRPSEDPPAHARAAALSRLDARLQAEQRVVERATARLNAADTALAEGVDVLVRARELAILGASGTFSDADRAVIAVEVRGLKERLVQAANRRDEAGRFLFAGAADAQPAFAPDEAGVVRYLGFGTGHGAEAAGLVGAAVPPGPAVFGPDDAGAFAALDALLAALAEPDGELRAEAFAVAMGRVEAAHDRIVVARAGLGVVLGRLEAEVERIASGRIELARGLAATQGLDLAAAITELETLRLTLAATQEVFRRVAGESLFDRLG